MTKYKVFFYYKGKKHFYTYNFKNAKEAKSWERAHNRYGKKDDKVYVDTTREIIRKRRTHSTRQRRNPYSSGLQWGFRL